MTEQGNDLIPIVRAAFEGLLSIGNETAIYSRSGWDNIEIQVITPKKTFTERGIEPTSGAFITLGKTQVWDFLCFADALVYRDEKFKPKKFDHVLRTLGNEQFTYEVTTRAGTKQWWWAEFTNQIIRVHTKMIGFQDAD